ncbi:cysteine-rich KTR domain-containing protein [Gemmiger formicilis]|uniref:cysteine-rich KTR domain-containing protein n=1 Tax=Gemmiger formicilis TaxID=745368 RepID=UPI001A9C4FAF|nr:cysteine-rich KTR domain-containing protein [Gemmiger formicilis]
MASITNRKSEWILCPICHCRTRIRVLKDTTLLNFPLFCPKCKREMLINIVDSKICVIKELN